MRPIVLVVALAVASTPVAAFSRIPLDPFAGSLGFEPERPRAVGSDHPLFGRLIVEDVQSMPSRIGSVFNPVSSEREFNAALRATFESANMLASSPDQAQARLRITWRRFDSPMHIGLTSRATVAVNYELSRIDDGQVIFSREIVTEAEFRGGNATIRVKETGRAAISANIASAALCIDKAAMQQAPQDCALRPVGSFSAPITVPVFHR